MARLKKVTGNKYEKTSMLLNEDTYWYIARYRVFNKMKSYSDVILKWLDIVKEKIPENKRYEILFDKNSRNQMRRIKVMNVNKDALWKLKEYQVMGRFENVDYALFNLIGLIQSLQGAW